MITIHDKIDCCGCQACANVCPKRCISMQADEEGFLYPHVNQTTCVNCGLCEKVCPILNKPVTRPVLKAYAAKHPDEPIRLKSSSGGVFTALADMVLQKQGVVFRATFDANWQVIHTYVENSDDLDKLRRSKYVQSNVGKTYQQAKDFLDQNRWVLFTGTPCQIAGLRNYLGMEYENLLTAELFCHGVPSPAVWEEFLVENTQKEQISAVNFRYKRFGWNCSFLHIAYKNNSSLPSVPKCLLPLLYARNGYLFRRFCLLPFGISNLYERPSCHACHFKGLDKMADFSMGDLWGVKHTYPGLFDKKGVSCLLVNTPKATKLLKKLALEKMPVDLEKVTAYNPYLLTSVKPHPKRADFFKCYTTEPFNALRARLTNKPWWKRQVQRIVRCLHINKGTRLWL